MTDRQVLTPEQSAAGTSVGAALLFELQDREAQRGRGDYVEVPAFAGETARDCLAYAERWRRNAERRRK